MKELTGKTCIYLVDDLAAELDPARRVKILEVLKALQAQVFLTAVEAEALGKARELVPVKMFHVEHDQIKIII